MKIAFVAPEYVTEDSYTGGLANYLHRIGLALIAAGHEPSVIVASHKNETIRHDGVKVHRVASSPFRSGRAISLAIKGSNRLLAGRFWMTRLLLTQSLALNGKLRALHAQDPFAIVQYPHLSAVGLFRIRGVPSVTRLSSYTPLWKEKGEYGPDSFAVSQIEFWERLAMKRTDALFGPCKIIAGRVSRDLMRPVEVIESPYISEPTQYDPIPYRDLLASREYMLFCGRFSPAKGIEILAEAAPEILKRHPNLSLVFVGSEQNIQDGRTMMHKIWERAGSMRGRVLFMGSMRHDQLFPILQNAIAVIMPSLIENFPNLCLEAMAHQRIVIGTYHTSFEQILQDGATGFLCEPGDPLSLSEAVEKVLALDCAERAAIGARAAEKLGEFAPDKITAKLLSLYNAVIELRSRKSKILQEPSKGGPSAV